MPLKRTDIETLKRWRLDRDLSWRALAEEIGLPERTVFRICTVPNSRIYERTEHKIRRYLETERARLVAQGAA